MYVLYGRMTFNNKSRRDNVSATMQTEATNRGLTPFAWGGFAAGIANTGNASMTFCYSSPDLAVMEQANVDLTNLLLQNQYEGDFGWQTV